MGIIKAIRRRSWKKVVVSEFDFIHAVPLAAITQKIGRTTINDILNGEYELAVENPQRGALNVARALQEKFGLELSPREGGPLG